MIILFFGQPASGKTTLADEFVKYAKLPADSKGFFRIDGDKWRLVSQNQDYSKSGRIQNLRSAFLMAKYIETENFIPVISFVAPYQSVRSLLSDSLLMQVYLTYQDDRGRNHYFAEDFEQPEGEYLALNTTNDSILTCTNKLLDYYTNLIK